MEQVKITIDGVEYVYDALSEKTKLLIEHINDVDAKIRAARFNLDQLNFTREALYVSLKQGLEAPPVVAE